MSTNDITICDTSFTKEQAQSALSKGYKKANEIINQPDKLEKLLQKIEQKLKSIPKVGEKLSHVPVFISLLNSYLKKEYTAVPLGTIMAIVSALLYLAAPVDLIPDTIPVVGHIDDAGVVTACFCLIESDIQEYLSWRDVTGNKY